MGWYDQNVVLVQSTFTAFLLALSIQLPLRAGVYSFSGVGSFAIGAYAAGILTIRYETPLVLTILAAGALAGVVSLVLSLLVIRLSGLYLAMATIAFNLIIGVVALNGGDFTGASTGLYGAITDIGTMHFIAVAGVIAVLVAFTERGRLGRRIDVVREDPELASAMGINVARQRRIAMVGSGLVGGCAGALTVLQRTTVSPVDIGFNLLVLGLTMVAVGGAGSWVGALIGAVIFTWLPSVLEVVGEWQQLVHGVIVVLAAVWFPGGIVGVIGRARRRWRRRVPDSALALDVAHADVKVDV